ncbi:hypothetical protein J437_LFUL008234 [Ladona fulva]|uniref:cytidine deaminase n=1 Tax=Ladona fulva TaxID=123851 RepID=A0A8K0K4T3_LADFU|nr:hypothetical protein J437_LFUL008234 [Ladona fulva]
MSNTNGSTVVPYRYLGEKAQLLINAAFSARKHAYCPFSKFAVGAAVSWCDSEGIDYGSNVESSSYGNSICAERTAATKGITEGKRRLEAVAVVAEMPDREEFVSPCGICRQFLFEFGDKVDIFLAKPSSLHEKVLVTSIDSLLPLGFRLNKLN